MAGRGPAVRNCCSQDVTKHRCPTSTHGRRHARPTGEAGVACRSARSGRSGTGYPAAVPYRPGNADNRLRRLSRRGSSPGPGSWATRPSGPALSLGKSRRNIRKRQRSVTISVADEPHSTRSRAKGPRGRSPCQPPECGSATRSARHTSRSEVFDGQGPLGRSGSWLVCETIRLVRRRCFDNR
jgi:hypothetical protein